MLAIPLADGELGVQTDRTAVPFLPDQLSVEKHRVWDHADQGTTRGCDPLLDAGVTDVSLERDPNLGAHGYLVAEDMPTATQVDTILAREHKTFA